MNVWVVDLNSRAEEKLYVNSENAIDALDANIYENVEDLAIYTNFHPGLPALPVHPDKNHIESNCVLTELIVDVLNPHHPPTDSSKNEKGTPDGSSSGISSGHSSSIESPQLSPSDSIDPDSGANGCPVSRSPDSGIFGLLRPVLTPPEADAGSKDPIRNRFDQTIKRFEKLEEESSTLVTSAHPHPRIESVPVHSGIPDSALAMPAAATHTPPADESDLTAELGLAADESGSTGSASSHDEEFRTAKNPSGPDGIFTASLVTLNSLPPSLESISAEAPEESKQPETPPPVAPSPLLSQAERDRLELIDRQKVKIKRLDSWLPPEKGLQSPVNDDRLAETTPKPVDGTCAAQAPLDTSQDPLVSATELAEVPVDASTVETRTCVEPPIDGVNDGNGRVSDTQHRRLRLEKAPVKTDLEPVGEAAAPVSTTQLAQPPQEVVPMAVETAKQPLEPAVTTQSHQPPEDGTEEADTSDSVTECAEPPLDASLYPNGKSHLHSCMPIAWSLTLHDFKAFSVDV